MNKKVVILGGGISGLTTAHKLVKNGFKNVTLVEKNQTPGGLASSWIHQGRSFDLGSHRIHPQYYPDALKLIEELLPGQLLRRPRSGQILLKNRFTDYPPGLKSVVSGLGLEYSYPILRDYLIAALRKPFVARRGDTFAEVLTSELGRSLFDAVFDPYAKKLWRLNSNEIDASAASHRTANFSLLSSLRQVFGRHSAKEYLYPREGIGAISKALADRFVREGGQLITGSSLHDVKLIDGSISELKILSDNNESILNPDLVVSTIPLDTIYSIVSSATSASSSKPFPLEWRGIRLVLVSTSDDSDYPNETFYIPSNEYLVGRVSELVKYSPHLNQGDTGRFLTCEIPCSLHEPLWGMPDAELMKRVQHELIELKIVKSNSTLNVDRSAIYNIPYVYPVYQIGWSQHLKSIFSFLDSVKNLIVTGRTGLFLHCNIDHCIKMGLDTADFLLSSEPSLESWRSIKKGFYRYNVRA